MIQNLTMEVDDVGGLRVTCGDLGFYIASPKYREADKVGDLFLDLAGRFSELKTAIEAVPGTVQKFSLGAPSGWRVLRPLAHNEKPDYAMNFSDPWFLCEKVMG